MSTGERETEAARRQMLKILAHRGWWQTKAEQNSDVAFRRALEAGYGIETDIRDQDGRLVISHDPPTSNATTVDRLMDLCGTLKSSATLALNIKADGLAKPMSDLVGRYARQDYFVFDMSVPDTLPYLALGMKVFTRRSEFETGSSLDDRAAGLWLDSFEAVHVPTDIMVAALGRTAGIALVSPELHGKPHIAAWESWRMALRPDTVRFEKRIFLCTDYPDQAHRFFAGHSP